MIFYKHVSKENKTTKENSDVLAPKETLSTKKICKSKNKEPETASSTEKEGGYSGWLYDCYKHWRKQVRVSQIYEKQVIDDNLSESEDENKIGNKN